MLRSSITSMMTSVSDPPIWNPTLPPSMRSAPGAPQPPSAVRHTRKPRPYLAPTMNAPCLTPGTTTTQCAFLSRSSGMPLSGAARTSFRTVADSPSRSAAVSASRLVDAIPRHNKQTQNSTHVRLPRSWYRDAARTPTAAAGHNSSLCGHNPRITARKKRRVNAGHLQSNGRRDARARSTDRRDPAHPGQARRQPPSVDAPGSGCPSAAARRRKGFPHVEPYAAARSRRSGRLRANRLAGPHFIGIGRMSPASGVRTRRPIRTSWG